MREKPVVELFQRRRAQMGFLMKMQELQVTTHSPIVKAGVSVLSRVAELSYAHTEGQLARHTDVTTTAQLYSGEFNTGSSDLLEPLPIDEV